MVDKQYIPIANGPARGAFAVSPSDSSNFATPARSLWVGAAGNVTVLTWDDQVVTFVNVPAGTLLPIATQRVNNTGTTASSIVGMY